MSSSTLWWLYNFIVDVLPMHTVVIGKKAMECAWNTSFHYLLNDLDTFPPPSNEKLLHFSLPSYDQFHMNMREMKTMKIPIDEIMTDIFAPSYVDVFQKICHVKYHPAIKLAS